MARSVLSPIVGWVIYLDWPLDLCLVLPGLTDALISALNLFSFAKVGLEVFLRQCVEDILYECFYE